MLKEQLRFNQDGKFKIMVIGDMHEKPDIESLKGRLKYRDMMVMLQTALNELKPDLVVLNGDTCTDHGGDTDDIFLSQFKSTFNRVTRPMLDREIPIAAVLGNHEHDTEPERVKGMVEYYNSIDGCCMENDDPSITGDANYNLTILGSAEDKVKFNLWFIDSNNCCDDREISNYDWVHKDQIAWYERKAAALAEANGGEMVPAVLFQHIPVAEEYRLLRKARPWEIPSAVRGHAKWNKDFYVLRSGVEGYLGEGPCAPCYDDGQFDSWKKTGDIVAAFFGHDHLNDFCGKVDGIMLGQCKTGGFRAYTDGGRSGYRLITLDENNPREIETKMYHFKEFGLKSKSLGPIENRITDRQSMNMHFASKVAAGVAAVGAATYLTVRLIKKKK